MATLYDYLAGLSVNGEPLVWSDNPLSRDQLDQAGRNPYVRVRELNELPTTPMYQNQDIVEQFVDVQIHQAVDDKNNIPSRTPATALYFELQDAVHHMDQWIYGQPLIKAHRSVSSPPRYNDATGGIFGVVRFRLLFPRG